jgi:deazaflavin-dependent oxidoreductase (nitroreductase family)
MGYKKAMNRFSATRFGSWVARNTAARVDPFIFKMSGGRFTSIGPKTIPQLVLTTTGRKSGKARSVQLGFLADGNDYVVVASNFGQEHHPAWSLNLLSDPKATVQVGKAPVSVTAKQLTDDDKSKIWSRVAHVIPQMHTYIKRTDRNIRLFRLTPDT